MYSITEEIEKIDRTIEEAQGEITPEVEEAMGNVQSLIQNKMDNVVGYVRYMEDSIKAINERRKEIASLESSLKKKLENFKGYVVTCLSHVEVKKMETPTARVTLPKPRAVLRFDENKLPLEYFKEVPAQLVPDTEKIKRHLEAGEEVKGAWLEDGKQSIQFKFKKGAM